MPISKSKVTVRENASTGTRTISFDVPPLKLQNVTWLYVAGTPQELIDAARAIGLQPELLK